MEKNKTGTSEVFCTEKDVIGLDKLNNGFTRPPRPNRLYFGIGLVVLAIYIVYWLMHRLH